MPCESCSVQFSVFKRKRICTECARYYCSSCLRRGGAGGSMCGPCRLLSTRPLVRLNLSHLKVRDFQYFLHRQNISTRGCVEKEDLINLVVIHVNSGAYRRKQSQQFPNSPDFSNPFNTLKGFTNNINNLFNSAFDIGPQTEPNRNQTTAHQEQTRQTREPASRNNVNVNASTFSTPSTSGQTRSTAQFRSSGEPSSSQSTSPPEVVVSTASDSPENSIHLDTDDVLEVEDVEDAAEWEFVRRPAEPLPSDSVILIAENLNEDSRAASEIDLRRSESNGSITDTSSLKDEVTFVPFDPNKRVNLEDLKSIRHLEILTVKQLKELLMSNRVDFKGCCERLELLERAKRLWKESTKSREDLDELSEDQCRICMDAPMECVMLECGHIATCTACGKRLHECPICRQYVVRVVRFFRS